MTDSRYKDVLQEFALSDAEVVHHRAVTFFLRLPRWSGRTPELHPEVDYLLGLAFAGIIPIAALLAVLVVLLTLMIARYSCFRLSQDQKQVKRRQKPAGSKVGFLIASTFLYHLFVLGLALGVLGAIATSEATLNLSSSVYGLLTDMRKTGLSLMDFALWIKQQFISFDPRTLDDGTTAGEFLVTAFETLVDYVPPRFPELQPLRNSLATLLKQIMDIMATVDDYVGWVFTGIVAVSVLTMLALVFPLTESMFTKRHRPCSIFMLVLYILFPFLLSWIFFAIWTGVGIVVADGCVMVQDYREFLRSGRLNNNTRNILIDSGLVCPTGEEAKQLENQIMSTSDSVLDNPLAADTITLLLRVNGSQLGESTKWAAEEILEYINCNVLVRFSGRLERLTCGARATSLLSGIFLMWIASLLLSVLVSAFFICVIFGLPFVWTFAVWDLPRFSADFVAMEYDDLDSQHCSLSNQKEEDVAIDESITDGET